ncbi:hypothetical protein [Bradyrhizobium sp. 172]|uniref:hypothetical protein n=1 Tax=Bradyrhizobium sp. 172 TaxID=2782643 RepID=UPI001FFF94B9|nr:hypothetical protein [Bradyrhizobium sp. 172]UPJ94890.1 hypothetical protein IVB07_31475 [Bradyrhizobium sp. 172]
MMPPMRKASGRAGQPSTMRFVAVNSAELQVAAVVFRARDLLVRQPTQTINAIWSHPADESSHPATQNRHEQRGALGDQG